MPGRRRSSTLEDAYHLLSPVLGVPTASAVFGIALIASGLSSSITGTMAGQVVMEGFLDVRVSRARRALLTRCLAIVPAVLIAASFGTAGVSRLLVFSQVVLGLQLPFAVVPLLWFTTAASIWEFTRLPCSRVVCSGASRRRWSSSMHGSSTNCSSRVCLPNLDIGGVHYVHC